MIEHLPPAIIIIVGALLVPLLPARVRGFYMVLLPIVSLAMLLQMPHGTYWRYSVFDYELALYRIDSLSFVFGLIFHIAAILSVVYSLHEKDTVQQVSGLIYAGSGIGAAFAGDLISLFVFWEFTAIASVFLIWARRTERAYQTGLRYLVIQVGSGVLLLAGVLVRVQAGHGLNFDHIGLEGAGGWLIFLAFGIKCAFPFLHNWLQDAYPEATVTGTVFLSAFTTKLAVYALARGYAGTELLIPIGALMTAFPIFFAVIENDLRRVLAYSLNNQLGFMVVGVGIGTEMALNGTAAHAFTHILYKALLFMSMGAVLLRTGTANGSDLGGLYRSMPYTMVFCCIGAASISAFPLFSGFISKSLIISEAAGGHYMITWFMLVFASAGVFHHSGIKIPFFAFFAHDSGIRCQEAPKNMLIAMGITAFLCIAIGVFPEPLYSILPYPVDYQPYTTAHVITQLQLLFFSALAFVFLQRTGIYPPELRSVNLDTDWIYRRLFPGMINVVVRFGKPVKDTFFEGGKAVIRSGVGLIASFHNPYGVWGRTWLTRHSVLAIVVFLAVYLLFYY